MMDPILHATDMFLKDRQRQRWPWRGGRWAKPSSPKRVDWDAPPSWRW